MRNIFYTCDDSNGLHDITLNMMSKCKLYQIQANASDFQCFYYNLFSGLWAQNGFEFCLVTIITFSSHI